jgi:KRAB domain-containing zinc finger protein
MRENLLSNILLIFLHFSQAIRENEEIIKQEADEKCLVITRTQTVAEEDADISTIAIESSPEQIQKQENVAVDILMKEVNDCNIVDKADGTTQFACSECRSVFRDEDTALAHVQKFGSNDLCKNSVCSKCDVVFLTEKIYKRHLSFHCLSLSPFVKSLNYFECSTCSVIYGSQKDLDSHLLLHAQENYRFQPEAATRLDAVGELLVRDLEPESASFSCGYCSKSGQKTDVNLHLTFFHANLSCHICKQEFSRSLGYFVDHMKIKHPEQFGEVNLTFLCPHCDMEFNSKAESSSHLKECQAKRFECHHCPKRFGTERLLKIHLSSVNGIKNHKCTFCDKLFANQTEMKVHERSHTKDKPYQCSFPGCNKKFRTNSHRYFKTFQII